MQDAWYGDNRDLVKWSVLAHLLANRGASLVVQVAFLRSAKRPMIAIAGREIPLASTVWEHFRDPKLIQRLGDCLGVRILFWEEPFSHSSRKAYVKALVARLRADDSSKIVLLDPDTGIEPQTPNTKHVTITEVTAVWEALAPDDVLVLYQHAYRDREWCKKTQSKFSRACGDAAVTTATAKAAAADVAFHIARRPPSGPCAA